MKYLSILFCAAMSGYTRMDELQRKESREKVTKVTVSFREARQISHAGELSDIYFQRLNQRT